MSVKSATELDLQVGRKLREMRQRHGSSQGELAAALGVTFQQVQKYEKGTNRISVGRLQRIADTLGVGVEYFFESAASMDGARPAAIPFLSKEAVQLAESFDGIRDPKLRRRVIALVKALCASGERN